MESKSRGLPCGVTEGVREWACSEGLKICKNDFLCQIVTHVQNGNLSWQNGSIIKKYVTEAKRRGLPCDVIGSENTTIASSTSSFTNTTTPKNAFRGESIMKRKQIQYALKKPNYYNISIDALYGWGTERALSGSVNAKGLKDVHHTVFSAVF